MPVTPLEDYEIEALFRGGSLARTMLIKENGILKIRKEADGKTSPYAFEKLKEQAAWIEAHQHLVPRIPRLLRKMSYGEIFAIDLEYYESLGFFEYIHSKPLESSKRMLSKLVDFCFRELYAKGKRSGDGNKEKLGALLQNKLHGKFAEAIRADPAIKAFSQYDTILVNHKEYINYSAIAKLITSDENTLGEIAITETADIHGDPTVENVLCVNPAGGNAEAEESFVLIDPNPDNILNTPLVDMAKISQSLNSGWEFLVQAEECDVFGNQVIFNANSSVNYHLLNDFFRAKLSEHLNENEMENMLFFEALNYSRALPIRQKINPKTSLIYYAIAVKLLNEFAEKKGLLK